MENTGNLLSPPHRLAVAYAPPAVRNAFSLLLEFDARLAAVVANASEPLIGQLKLAWWRDAIAMEPERRPRGEPLLARLAFLDGQGLNGQCVTAAMSQLVDAWEGLHVGAGRTEALSAFAKARGAAIFGTYAGWAASDADVLSLGEAWAVTDLTGNAGQEKRGLALFRDRKLRPLTILALSVRGVSGPRLLWHALTGR